MSCKAWVPFKVFIPFFLWLGLSDCKVNDDTGQPIRQDSVRTEDSIVSRFSFMDQSFSGKYMTKFPTGGPWKVCTSTVTRSRFRSEGDTLLANQISNSKCFYEGWWDTTRFYESDSFDYMLRKDTLFHRKESEWSVALGNPWLRLERARKVDLYRAKFLGDSVWAFAQKYESSLINPQRSYLFIPNVGLVLSDNFHRGCMNCSTTGQYIKLIEYLGHASAEIDSSIESIMNSIPYSQ